MNMFEVWDSAWNGLTGAIRDNPVLLNSIVIITFLYSMTPSIIPLPNEAIYGIALESITDEAEKFNQLIFFIILTAIGGGIGDFIMFKIAKHHGHKVVGKLGGSKKKRAEFKFTKIYHHYGMLIYLVTPSLFFGFGIAEVSLVVGGYLQIPDRKILPFLFAGNFIRAIWGGMAILGLVTIL